MLRISRGPVLLPSVCLLHLYGVAPLLDALDVSSDMTLTTALLQINGGRSRKIRQRPQVFTPGARSQEPDDLEQSAHLPSSVFISPRRISSDCNVTSHCAIMWAHAASCGF